MGGSVRFANAHLSDDEAVAKMGHPMWWRFVVDCGYGRLAAGWVVGDVDGDGDGGGAGSERGCGGAEL